jgi:resuscitation-promoting factor RpfB
MSGRLPDRSRLTLLAVLAAGLLLAACAPPRLSQGDITVGVTADGVTREVSLAAGSTAEEALLAAGVTPGELDRSTPPLYTVLTDGDTVRLTRVQEIFETEQEALPFESQTVRNESLPAGETRLIQSGIPGLREITYRRLLEDGEEVSRAVVRLTVLREPQAEILMVGVQSPFAPLAIPGRLVYLAGGNAWLMEGSTTNRRPLLTSGDLDGRVFSLSPDGNWLLFTRKSTRAADVEINTLWVLSLSGAMQNPLSLRAANVVHFAGFSPLESNTVLFSTVEPRPTAPGWQANNDLQRVRFGVGWAGTAQKVVETNSGGVYGWWGTDFAWAPNGQLAYARPDGVGLVDLERGTLSPLLEITLYQTGGDWAWIPGLAWGADSRSLFVVTHAPPPGLVAPEESPYFDLSGVSLVNGAAARMVQQAGMFAYPAASPLRRAGEERGYQLAYLQAIFPAQSETSRYRLAVMDRDGSNRRLLFPPPDSPGLDPQTPVWSPQPLASGSDFLAVVYQGNLWLVDEAGGQAYQVTGDGLIARVDWK